MCFTLAGPRRCLATKPASKVSLRINARFACGAACTPFNQGYAERTFRAAQPACCVLPMAAAVGGADVMASVVALSHKGVLLSQKGHLARAAEKFAAAATAAQSLQQPDCLIVTYLQLQELSVLFAHASVLPPGAAAAAADERMFCVLLPAMFAALQRRKAAGTLLGDACRAHEATFMADENTLAQNARPLQPRNGRRRDCKLHVQLHVQQI